MLYVELQLCFVCEALERKALSNVHDLLPEEEDVLCMKATVLIFGELMLQLLELADNKVDCTYVLNHFCLEMLVLGLVERVLKLLEVIVQEFEERVRIQVEKLALRMVL